MRDWSFWISFDPLSWVHFWWSACEIIEWKLPSNPQVYISYLMDLQFGYLSQNLRNGLASLAEREGECLSLACFWGWRLSCWYCKRCPQFASSRQHPCKAPRRLLSQKHLSQATSQAISSMALPTWLIWLLSCPFYHQPQAIIWLLVLQKCQWDEPVKSRPQAQYRNRSSC